MTKLFVVKISSLTLTLNSPSFSEGKISPQPLKI